MNQYKKTIRPLKIGDKIAKLPIIQGGMGVGVSRSSLAGAVAAAGGVGIISTAQIGYDEDNFEQDQQGCNRRAIHKHIRRAKEIATDALGKCSGLVGVNVMVALKHYREHVKEAVAAGADVVICGAGLPLDLPELVEGSDTKIAPVVSGVRACKLILRQWAKKYHRTADFIVVEGPEAGGHLGFHMDDLEKFGFAGENGQQENPRAVMDKEIRDIVSFKEEYENEFGCHIPVVAGGGIFDYSDVEHTLELGAEGVQVASRFVTTYECDASEAYKQAYLNAKEEDIRIIKSPVGLPGRALYNNFVKRAQEGVYKVKKCYQCLAKCNPSEVPYCITKALVDAVRGDTENGLVFCGANAGRIHEMMSVQELMDELTGVVS